ncbi:hypothetical protein F4805DRAFT_46247 [Annulohypoxylon moriforme]|nr:hypothetical protein F4805DRAFT_46247 [Annulohypoxylon moriforme]
MTLEQTIVYYPYTIADDGSQQWIPMDDIDPIIHRPEQQQSSTSFLEKSPTLGLGKPVAKKRVHRIDIFATFISFVCLALGVATVADSRLSWMLGQGTDQLVVLGFLLSIMSICLGSVVTTLFLLLEASYGKSILQNYDGIIRNTPFASRLSWSWRLTLGIMMALPVGLSVAYKRFAGGTSSMAVDPASYIGNSSYYGMFAPPTLQNIGFKSGITLFNNATLDFSVNTAPSSSTAPEPELPKGPKAYGYNILLLNNESTAVLDLPQPDYISSVQSMLALGESWSMKAPVLATVATLNHSKQETPAQWNASFLWSCEAAKNSSGAYSHQSLMNHWAVDLMDNASPGNQTQQYIGITYDFGINHMGSCENFSHYVHQFDVTRQQCEGTWTITRGSVNLVDGACNSTTYPTDKQYIIANNTMFLGVYYMQSLMEMLGPFSVVRNQSSWAGRYYATAVATMLWSRLVALNNPVNAQESGKELIWTATPTGQGMTYEEVGLVYSVRDTVTYTRPVLRKSPWLFLVLALQPALLVLTLVVMAFMYSTPLDKGFGLVSILSGIHSETLDSLSGATLSGELTKDVRLVLQSTHKNRVDSIQYHIAPLSAASVQNGRLAKETVYH